VEPGTDGQGFCLRLQLVVGGLLPGQRRAKCRDNGPVHPARRPTATAPGPWPTSTLTAYAGQSVQILIEAADASTASLVEAGVDDVRIVQS
jgi:hypothetical protein